MPITIDPQQRLERERKRVRRMMDPKSYLPGYRERGAGIPQRRKGIDLDDETRKNLLGSIAQNTLGALYQFGNVLDLPGSSARDVASTIAGKPRNPFDQWLSPTTEEGRVRGRELLREWGMAGNRDTWGNLAGGIGLEIGLDPLTYLAPGAGALTKHGQLLKKAGVLDLLPDYLAKVAPGRAASKLAPLGRREALQKITDAEDIFKHLDPVQQIDARRALNQAADRFGYKGTKAPIMGHETQITSPYAQFLAEEGAKPLSGFIRGGLPNWRIFGASPRNKLRPSPGKIFGTPGSERLTNYAKRADAASRRIRDTALMRHLGGLMNYANQGMVAPVTRQAARAFTSRDQIADGYVREITHQTLQDFDLARGSGWMERVYDGLPTAQRTRAHNFFRRMFEVRDSLDEAIRSGAKQKQFGGTRFTQADKQAVNNVMGHVASYMERAKSRAVSMDWLDDDFVDYFPRQLSEALRTGGKKTLQQMHPELFGSLKTSAFTPHMLARVGPLRDIKGGSEMLNEVALDPKVVAIKNNPNLDKAKKIRQIEGYLDQNDRYREAFPDLYRSRQLTRGLAGETSPEVIAERAELHYRAYSSDSYEAIHRRTDLTDYEKAAEVQAKLREINVRTDTNWGPGTEGWPSITPQTRLWETRGGRRRVLAQMLVNAPDEVHQHGFFGNFAINDVETYFQSMEDSLNRADFAMDVLRHPHSLYEAGLDAAQPSQMTLGEMLQNLSFDRDAALQKLAAAHGVEVRSADDLKRFARTKLSKPIEDDLLRFKQMFEGPEAANFLVRIADSLQSAFKANVTSPWPAFAGRNHITGMLRNKVAGMFSWRSYRQALRIMNGKNVPGVEGWPVIQQQFKELQRRMPGTAGELTNERANDILRGLMREGDLTGSYEIRAGAEAISETRHRGGGQVGQVSSAGQPESWKATTPGSYGFSPRHAARSYAGFKQPTDRIFKRNPATGKLDVTQLPAKTTSPLPQFTPFPGFDMPFWLGRKAISKGYGRFAGREALRRSPKLSQWADEPFWRLPRELKVRGVYEKMGLTGEKAKLMQDTGAPMYGPVKGGEEFNYWVEGMNRIQPWLHRIQEGVDPRLAAREVAGAQVEYGSKAYAPFERQVLKRMIPFYSFSRKSVPWAARKFYEEPHNILRQVIRGTQRTGQHLEEQFEREEGPIPPYVRDTLAIPLPTDAPGVKRFLTGADVMSQDLWQLLMPLMAGEWSDLGAEVASRSNPLLLKYPMETITGTSLWQRGVEGGRPLRTLSPPIGRLLANWGQTWEKWTGNEYPPGFYSHVLKDRPIERLASSSPYTRALSTGRKLLDVRKGPLAKAASTLGSVGIRDISPRQQQAILREHLRSMLTKAGGSTFEKAVLSQRDLEELGPEQAKRALQLQALAHEQAEIAKDLRQKARRGLPGY